MSDCLSLIDNRISQSEIAKWVNVSQMTNIVHTEEVQIISAASGYLDIEVFCIPDLDCRVVGYLVYHCCNTGKIHSWTEEVICHVFQDGPDTCIKLDCWELNPKPKAAEPDVCWVSDPCQRAYELNCCLMQRAKEGIKTSWSFRDSSGGTKFLSDAKLCEMIATAESECEAMSCRNSRCITFSCGVNCG